MCLMNNFGYVLIVFFFLKIIYTPQNRFLAKSLYPCYCRLLDTNYIFYL